MTRLFIFDFDGVVVASLDTYEGTVKQCLEKIGQPIVRNRQDFLELFEDNFYESLVKKGVNLEAFMACSGDILAQVDYGAIEPYADLLPVLQSLQRENILVIVSSSDSQDIRQIMTRYHLTDYFRDVFGSDVHLSKREKILQALAKHRVPKENTFYVGDTTGDIKEGKAVGVRTIAVTWGWHTREQLLALAPDYLIDSPEQLLTVS